VTILLPSAPPVVQPPRVRSVPDYAFTSGVEAVELAESVGLVPDSWQRDAVFDILAEDSAGRWSTFESALIEPRQNGKGTVLEVVDLADLFLFSSSQRDFLAIHTAHEFKTAQEAFRRVLFWVENNDWLRKKVARIRTSHGEEGIELLSGARLRFLARSSGSGRGFSCDRLTYDEAYDLPDETVAASLPTMSARPNPSVIYTSSAPLDGVKSAALRRVMRRGRREPLEKDGPVPDADPNLCYIEFSADPKADLDDREAWAQANPAVVSGRMSLDFIAKERAAMSEVAFARERLGILDESKGATVIDLDVWDSLGDPLASPLDPVAFAIDVNPDATFTSIAVAGRTADGFTFAQVVDRKRGTGWVVDRVEELVEKWRPSEVVLDSIGPAGSLLPAFSERGIEIGVVGMQGYGQACGGFKALVDERRLRHNKQTGLRAALESARKRPLGDAGLWGWHRRDTTDITPLVAVTLATYAFARSVGEANRAEDNRVIVFR
jgi:phage terminase large subunit-like protein